MKKQDLKKLAILGITAGVMVSAQGQVVANEEKSVETSSLLAAGHCNSKPDGTCATKRSGCAGSSPARSSCSSSYRSGCGGCGGKKIADATETFKPAVGHEVSQDQLRNQLSDQGKQDFDKLSPEGKAQAARIASQHCKGQNSCKGQGGCKTNDHGCKGQNSCKGNGGCAVSKEDAVKISKEQALKRSQATGY